MLDFKEYVKKPIPVKVCQLTEDLWNKLNSCVDNETRINEYTLQTKLENEVDKVFYVNTLEDVEKNKLHKAKINDYLIVGVEGEIYACDKDIFEKTYYQNWEQTATGKITYIFLVSELFKQIGRFVEEDDTENWIFEDIKGKLWKYKTYSRNPFDIDISSIDEIEPEYLKKIGFTEAYNDYIKEKKNETENMSNSTITDIYQDACKLADLAKDIILGGDHLDCEDCYKSLKTQALKDYIDEKWQEY